MQFLGSLLGVLTFIIVAALVMGLVLTIIKRVSRGNTKVEWTLTIVFLAWLIYPIFVNPYPTYTSVVNVSGKSMTIDPDQSHNLVEIGRWEDVPGLGYIYLDRLDNVEDYQLWIYFRTIGFNKISPWEVGSLIKLTDDKGNDFECTGGGLGSGILLTGGVMEFDLPTIEIGGEFILSIGGHQIKF